MRIKASTLVVSAVAVAASLLGAAQAETVALTGATVIDGAGRAPIPNATVVITEGKITAVGPRASTRAPQGARQVDVTGKTIIPGLINAHGHVELARGSSEAPRKQLADQLALYARYGVTTVYSLGDDGVESVKLRDDLRKNGQGAHARFYVAGPILTPGDPATAKTQVDATAALGVDLIKTRLQGPATAPIRKPEVLKALMDEAHADKKRVAAHIFTEEEAQSILDAGGDIIAHSVRDKDVSPAFIAQMKARDVPYIPTLTRDLSVFVYESTPDFVSDPFFTKEASYKAALAPLLTPESQARTKTNASAQSIKPALEQARKNLKTLQAAGVTIAMGTDTGAPTGRWQGYFEHKELEMMVEAGLTPMQALVAATGGAAKAMRNDTIGTLQPGRAADLLVLGANPLTDIKNTKTLEQVWIGGVRVN